MREKIFTIVFVIIGLLLVLALGCNKEEEKANQPPTCKITAPPDGQKLSRGQIVTISVEAIDSDGSIAEVRFFVDGVGESSANSFPFNFNWNTTSKSMGNHILKATSIDNSGGSSVDEIIVEITQEGDSSMAAFTSTPTSGNVPLYVNFTDLSTSSPASWQWYFGDGGTSTQQNPTHTYSNEGSYAVSLTVSNTYGFDTEIKLNYITVSGVPCPGMETITYGGQVYNTVLIGSQCWMKENLNIGEMIPGDQEMEDNGIIEKYCHSDYPPFCATYGGLYQWNEIMKYTTQYGAQGICPSGWHIPTDEEWRTLEGTVDSQYGLLDPEWGHIGMRGLDAGFHLKSTARWYVNGNGDDSYGFSARPGGYRGFDSAFDCLGEYAYIWSSTGDSVSDAWYRDLYYYYYDGVGRYNASKASGFSVRCLQD